MIKVVIIDDDIEMLIGLKQIINWEQYGFTVVGEADNGEKGLELIRNYKPEVVITDITMPGINGLDLIEEAENIVPNIKAIILTCHENFHYAKQALKLKACEYVLKYTLTKEILVDMITNISRKIQVEESINKKFLKIDEELKSNKDILKQKIFKELIYNNDEDKDTLNIWREAEALNIKIPNKTYILACIFIDNLEISLSSAGVKSQVLDKSLESIFHDVYNDYENYGYFDYSADTKCILLWEDRDVKEGNSLSALLNSKLQLYQKSVKVGLGIRISITISSVYSDILKVREAFKECEELRNEYFYNESYNIVRLKKEKWTSCNNLYGKYKDEWIEVLLTGSNEKIINFIKKLSVEIKNFNYSPCIVKALFNNLIIDIKSLANKNGVEINCKTGFDTMEECAKSLEKAIIVYGEGLEAALNGSFRNEIKKVLQYIDENLSQHISCDKMSEYIKMNTNYFSRLFKKEIGMSFSDYIIKKRVEKATYFLKYSGLAVEEIAFLTGFSNVSYFYKTYKKITGKTPKEIRVS
jgi:two-component system response regulator YesN